MSEIEKLQKQIDDLKKRIEQLESKDGMSPYSPPFKPYEFNHKTYVCSVCGIDLTGMTHRVCYHPNCPTTTRITLGA